jgi:hypothetical protein
MAEKKISAGPRLAHFGAMQQQLVAQFSHPGARQLLFTSPLRVLQGRGNRGWSKIVRPVKGTASRVPT